MKESSLVHDVDLVCDLFKNAMKQDVRIIVGIAGPPASGKSTLAESVVRELNKGCSTMWPTAVLLPMDGYHLDNRLLESRGLLLRKGAPETFDAHGFCSAISQLQSEKHETFYPVFDRQMDLAIANAISIHPKTPVIVVEGNYLLLKSGVWSSLREFFTTTVFICPSMDDLQGRLNQRWIRNGLDPKAAALRVEGNDMPNAKLVVHESHKADLYLNQNYTELGVHHVD